MPKGQYSQYLREVTVPIPRTTIERRHRQRALRLTGRSKMQLQVSMTIYIYAINIIMPPIFYLLLSL